MKVLFLSDFFLSGQTTHVLELAKQLRILGVEVHIAFGAIHSKLFWTHYAGYLQKHNISYSEGADLATLKSRCQSLKPDLIHSQSSTLFQRAQLLSSRLGIPYILTCHGLGFNQLRYRHLLLMASAVIAIGPNVAQEIAGLSHTIVTIPNGIDTESFTPPSESLGPRKSIIYIGRLEQKRIEPLRQLALAHEALVKSPLRIISNWNPGIPGTIFRSWQPDPIPYLQNAGIVAACGRTAREAMSCGNVVLLMQQRYDGVISPNLVTRYDFDFSGNVGRFPYENVRSDLEDLLQSPSKLKKLQNWSRKYAVAHLSSEQMAKRTVNVYIEAIKSPKKAPSRSMGP